MRQTSMNTASPYPSPSLGILPQQFVEGNGMEEVVGSIPTRSIIFSMTYRLPDRSVGSTGHTFVKDPNRALCLRLDVNGELVSNKFKNKVVLAIVTRAWCPHCHARRNIWSSFMASTTTEGSRS